MGMSLTELYVTKVKIYTRKKLRSISGCNDCLYDVSTLVQTEDEDATRLFYIQGLLKLSGLEENGYNSVG